jgi:prevent-host-death family protein
MDEYSIETARRSLGEIVDKARYTDEPTTITRQGKPVAVVLSTDWYASALEYIEHAAVQQEARDRWDALRKALLAGRRTAGLGPRDLRVVYHLDGDLLNNDPSNLEIRKSDQQS